MTRFEIIEFDGHVVIYDNKKRKAVLKCLTNDPKFVEFVVDLLNRNSIGS